MSNTDYDKTGKLYRKIDIYYKEAGGFVYACSTNQWRTCKSAKQSWADIHLNGKTVDSRGKAIVKARFATS